MYETVVGIPSGFQRKWRRDVRYSELWWSQRIMSRGKCPSYVIKKILKYLQIKNIYFYILNNFIVDKYGNK